MVVVSDRVVAMQQGMAGLRDVSIMLNLTTGISAEVDKQQKEQGQLFEANEEDHCRRDRRRSEVGIRPLARAATASLSRASASCRSFATAARVSPAASASEPSPHQPGRHTRAGELAQAEQPKVGKELVAGVSRRMVKALQDWHDKSDTIATMHRLMEHVSFHQVRHSRRAWRTV